MSLSFNARRLLLPLVPLYRLALAFREFRLCTGLKPVRRLRLPVISIGNLSTGGAGKTPLTVALANGLSARGFYVDVLSRGYGRQSTLAARVDPNGRAEEFGDEPLLIAREAGVPVYVAPQRYDAGLMAEQALSASTNLAVHLLDDGFQHRQLARDVDILLLNLQDWQDTPLPAGNLRESLTAIRRASVIAIPANEPELVEELNAWGWQGPVWRLRRNMEVPAVAGPVAAFCGIARPEQFFGGLEAAGLTVAFRRIFSDHHQYNVADINSLGSAARAAGATAFITTEKDLLRLGKLATALPASMPIVTARLTIEIEDEGAALNWLISRPGQTHLDIPCGKPLLLHRFQMICSLVADGISIGLPKLKPCKKSPFAIKMPVFLMENAVFQAKFARD
ncbi:MAG: tetraacyldisaccharide 4'-kinase [Terracidiphilus sp.]|jgi:tetraacyldisaccharide 4'-kinase